MPRGRHPGSVEIDPEARSAFTDLPVAMQHTFRTDAITRKKRVNWQSMVQDYTRTNSFIPDYPRYEFQADCAYMSWLSEESQNRKLMQNLKEYPHAFVCIDIFSKYGMVLPLRDPKYSPKETENRKPNPAPEEVAKAFRECCEDKNMGQPL
jgi:hypothetical protein